MTTAPTPPPPGTHSAPVRSDAGPPRAAGPRRDALLVALGVALLVTAIAISTVNSRKDGELDWSNYGVGLAATVGLLGIAVLSRLIAGRSGDAVGRELVSWPAAFGAVGAGAMLALGLDDASGTAYATGALVVALAALGYVLAPSAPPAVAAVFGLLLLYGEGFDDLVEVESDDNGLITFAVAVLVFVLVVSAAAWVLRPARVVVPVFVGAGAVIAYAGAMIGVTFAALFSSAFSGIDDGGEAPPRATEFDNDVYVILACAALLMAVWLVASYLSDGAGYRVLTVAMAVTVVPSAMLVLAVEHPSWWSLALGAVGGLVLVLAVLQARGRHTGHGGSDTHRAGPAPYQPPVGSFARAPTPAPTSFPAQGPTPTQQFERPAQGGPPTAPPPAPADPQQTMRRPDAPPPPPYGS